MFGVYRPTRAFFTHTETSQSVRVLLWHGASVYNGYLRGPVTLTPTAECLAVTTCFYDLGLSRLGFERPTFRLRGERDLVRNLKRLYPVVKKKLHYIRHLPAFPSRKVNSTQWHTFRFSREYMRTCAFILKLYILQCIFISMTSFFNIQLQKCLYRL